MDHSSCEVFSIVQFEPSKLQLMAAAPSFIISYYWEECAPIRFPLSHLGLLFARLKPSSLNPSSQVNMPYAPKHTGWTLYSFSAAFFNSGAPNKRAYLKYGLTSVTEKKQNHVPHCWPHSPLRSRQSKQHTKLRDTLLAHLSKRFV